MASHGGKECEGQPTRGLQVPFGSVPTKRPLLQELLLLFLLLLLLTGAEKNMQEQKLLFIQKLLFLLKLLYVQELPFNPSTYTRL